MNFIRETNYLSELLSDNQRIQSWKEWMFGTTNKVDIAVRTDYESFVIPPMKYIYWRVMKLNETICGFGGQTKLKDWI